MPKKYTTYIRVTILPIWTEGADTCAEAKERGRLMIEMLDLASEFEDKIKEMLEARDG